MKLFQISNSCRDAAGRTVEKAEQAERLGYTGVQTHYHPSDDGRPGLHSVTGDAPVVPESPARGGLFRR